MSAPLTQPLLQVAELWRSKTGGSRRRLAFASVALTWVMALLVVRYGKLWARLGGATLLAASVAMAAGWLLFSRSRLGKPTLIVRRLIYRFDRERADRALRALSLVGKDGQLCADGTSSDLARLHVARTLAQLPVERVAQSAAHTAARFRWAAFCGAMCVLGIVLVRAWSVLEGADVLLARGGVAPATMRWLDDLDVLARPPDYVHESERHALAFASLVLPYGTVITVRGVPVRAGRRLLLSNGTTEVPFVDDGSGGVVARWTLAQSASLHVVARFGDVAIGEPDALVVESAPDTPPIVSLGGAPRRLVLMEQTEDIAIKYQATDDHGLREVELVLRSGTREERRMLARLDGETKRTEGGSLLKIRDPFLKRSHAPIEVTIEAKDNDPLTGPKWGASAALTIVPPVVGEPEARRLDALRQLRDALVDSLAWRLSSPVPKDAAAREALVSEDKRRAAADDELVTSALTAESALVRLSPRVRASLLSEQEKMRRAIRTEATALWAGAHSNVIQAAEHFVLVTDAVFRGLAMRYARESARELAESADDLALGASQAQGGELAADRPSRATARMDEAAGVLSRGGRVMKRLGSLGRDLGEIMEADLLRVRRARDASDFVHAELAARDLAARLREPDPSFGSHGASFGRAGGESGGAPSIARDEPPPDDVDQAFAEAAHEVEQLAQDHAGAISSVDRALAESTSEEERSLLRQESKRHANAVREAVRPLPSIGSGSDSWTSKGAAARELAEQMARSLEQGKLHDAVQSGRGAIGAIDEAQNMLRKLRPAGGLFGGSIDSQLPRVEEARKQLESEQRWAEHELEQSLLRGAARAHRELEAGGEEEDKLADRARDLAQRARGRGSLPQQAVDSIDDAQRAARDAAEALKRGDAQRGVNRQREAQRALEAAKEQLRGDDEANEPSPSPHEGDGNAGATASGARIPPPGEHKGPDEFRRRVMRGLGQPSSGALRDAVQRYAEGLLR